jgi:hypothetical protein
VPQPKIVTNRGLYHWTTDVTLNEITAARLLDVCGNHGQLSSKLDRLAGRERFSVKIVLNDVQDE